jgi:hypothetical protein
MTHSYQYHGSEKESPFNDESDFGMKSLRGQVHAFRKGLGDNDARAFLSDKMKSTKTMNIQRMLAELSA